MVFELISIDAYPKIKEITVSDPKNIFHARSENISKNIGILLVNLGTPAACTTRAIASYLREFLSDPRVIEMPRLLWFPLLYGFILPFRSHTLKKNYHAIWLKDASPLLVYGKSLAEKLQASPKTSHFYFKFALRYGTPSIAEAFEAFYHAACQKIIVLPLYPQYSATTTGSTFDAVAAVLKKMRFLPELHFVNHYADHPAYIAALSKQVKTYLATHQAPNQFVFSFHGLPKRNLARGDPYYCYCQKTARLLAKAAQLNPKQWVVTFQSRFGRAEWLQPYTSNTLTKLAETNKKRIAILCPGFAADCLETLEEIQIQNKNIFLNAGGEQFDYLPCLNDSTTQITFFENFLTQF